LFPTWISNNHNKINFEKNRFTLFDFTNVKNNKNTFIADLIKINTIIYHDVKDIYLLKLLNQQKQRMYIFVVQNDLTF